MNAKSQGLLSVTDPRPNFPSGNYSIRGSISGSNSFKDLLKNGVINPIGSNQWYEVNMALARGWWGDKSR